MYCFKSIYFFNNSEKNEDTRGDEENINDHEATPLLSNQNTERVSHGEGK